MSTAVSVVVRARDKGGTIRATLEALRRQTVPVEIIVVDSGSTDGTLEIASRLADRLVELPASTFSYGRSLNAGAAVASCGVHAALSAHCVPSTTWLAESLRRYDDEQVAATGQAQVGPDGAPIVGTYHQTLADVSRNAGWGLSNHASTWSREVWSTTPFREDLPACEDKEWSWRVLASGRTIAYSPDLTVSMRHRRAEGLRALSERVAREAEVMVSLGAARPPTGRDAVRLWWSSFPNPSPWPSMLRRLSPYRLAEVVGAVRGGRRGSRGGGRGLWDLLEAAGEPRPEWVFAPWG